MKCSFHKSAVVSCSPTCHIDLHLQAAVLGDWYGGSFSDYSTLHCLWHDNPNGVQFRSSVRRKMLLRLDAVRVPVNLQEVSHQLQPVEDEKNPQVIEDHCKA